MHNEVKELGNRIYEFTDFMVKCLKVYNFGASLNVTATYHDSCAALRECNIKAGATNAFKECKRLGIG